MKPIALSAIASAALLLTAQQGVSATTVSLTIDEYDTFQVVKDDPIPGFTNASELADPGVLGGFRDFYVENTGATGSADDSTELKSDSGLLSFSNVAGATGLGYITYDGNDGDPMTVDTTGLGGINLDIGINPYFAFDVAYFDRDVFIQVEAWDMTGKTVSYAEKLTTGFNPNLPFSDLTGDAGFDWTQVGALQFFVDSTNTDISVDGQLYSIKVVAAIPVPASGLLLLGSVAGVPLLRRRKKAKAA